MEAGVHIYVHSTRMTSCRRTVPPMTPYVTIITPKLGENVDRMKPALEINAPVIVIARQPNRFARTLARGPAKQLITNQSAQQETPSY